VNSQSASLVNFLSTSQLTINLRDKIGHSQFYVYWTRSACEFFYPHHNWPL